MTHWTLLLTRVTQQASQWDIQCMQFDLAHVKGWQRIPSQHKAYGAAKPQHPSTGSPQINSTGIDTGGTISLQCHMAWVGIEPRMLRLPACHKLCAGCHPGPVESYFLW